MFVFINISNVMSWNFIILKIYIGNISHPVHNAQLYSINWLILITFHLNVQLIRYDTINKSTK